jgi:hypothetical protein
MEVPPIGFGVFAIRNIRLGTGLALPLTGDPLRFDFNFSTFKQPFELSVMCFGGRGSFELMLDTSGERDLRASLEFGGSLTFDVVVASGGLYVMAGGYYRSTRTTTELSAYLRAGGTLQVLGLIHASVEFLLMLTYREEGSQSQLYGIARITVSIDLFLFSIDVPISMEQRIAGSENASRAPSVTRYISATPPALRGPASSGFAYFDHQDLPGKFESTDRWRREYWSQFDFQCV